MRWLIPRLNNLPNSVRTEATELMEIWQTKAPAGLVLRKEIGEIAISWLKEVERSFKGD